MKHFTGFSYRLRGALVVTGIMMASSLGAYAAEEGKKSALNQYLLDGGPLTIFIVGFGLISFVALAVFNGINMTKKNYVPEELKGTLLDHMTACRVRSAIEVSSESPTYLGRMLAYSLPNIDATEPETLGREKVEDAIADFAINEGRKNMLWINLLALLAQAAPMMGLFGTVFGMIKAFSTLGGSGQADPGQLAGDIRVALLTTMWGLVVALLSVFGYFFFKHRYNTLVAECHHTSEELVNSSLQTINQDAYLAKIPEGIATE